MNGAIIILAERHSTAGGSDHGEFGFKLPVAAGELVHRRDHHVRGPVQPGSFPVASAVGQEPLIGDLAGGFAAGIGHTEPSYRGDAIGCLAEVLEGFWEAEPEGADNSGGDDCDSGTRRCSARTVKSRHVTR